MQNSKDKLLIPSSKKAAALERPPANLFIGRMRGIQFVGPAIAFRNRTDVQN
jgi:hypothetical protein